MSPSGRITQTLRPDGLLHLAVDFNGEIDGTALHCQAGRVVELRTERLLIRDWRDDDLAPWAAMNADPAVREFLGPVLTADQATASVRRFQAAAAEHGFCFWAVEVTATGEFIGFTGLDVIDDFLPFSGVEIGWRLARSAWGHGYASEAATAVLEYSFGPLGLPELYAVTATDNVRSQAVMHRIGMHPAPELAFVDPDDGRDQVVYRVASSDPS